MSAYVLVSTTALSIEPDLADLARSKMMRNAPESCKVR